MPIQRCTTGVLDVRYCESYDIQLPSTLKTVGTYAFSHLEKVDSITIPDGVTSIGIQAFRDVPHIEYHGTASGSPWGALSIN